MKTRIVLVLASLMALGGCASAPNATFAYHPPVLRVAASVTLTVSCNGDKTRPVYQIAPTVTPTYTADRDVTWTVDVPHSAFADIEFTPQFTDDGQLTAINSTLAGQGSTILKDLVSLGADVGAAGGGSGARTTLGVCNGYLSQPVSIIYDATLDFSAANFANSINKAIRLEPRSYLLSLDAKLRDSKQLPDMPSFQAFVSIADDARIRFDDASVKSNDFIALKLREVASGELKLKDATSGLVVYDSALPIPRADKKDNFYVMLLPKPALFGGSTFALSLSTAGAIKSVDYKTTSGMAGALEVGSSAITAATPTSAATRAAELKAQADVIAQQTRLAKCVAAPASCQ